LTPGEANAEHGYMSDPKLYSGGCHCGKVRYEVTLQLGQVISCNCSICSKRGALLTFVPGEAFRLLSGSDFLSDYQFYKKQIHHLFCKICGVSSFATGTGPDGKPSYAINVRCLDDVDLSTLQTMPFDGKSL
jgi:hypothetical protein